MCPDFSSTGYFYELGPALFLIGIRVATYTE